MSNKRAGDIHSNGCGYCAVQVSGGTSIVVGVVVLLGWAFDIPAIKYVLPGIVAMKANAAIGFILLGTALLCHRTDQFGRLLVCYTAAGLLLSLSAATLGEYVLNRNLGIDEFLFLDDEAQPSGLFQPGRMSPMAAISFLLLTFAILQSRCDSRWARCGEQFCILVPLLISARALVGYLYGVPILHQLGQGASMALHTTITFIVASIGLQLSRRDSYLASLFDCPTVGSKMARQVLLWAIGLPVGLGLFCIQGEKLGFCNSRVGLTIFAVLMALLLTLFLIAWSRRMNYLDRQREVAAEAAREFRHASERDALTGLLNRRGFLEQCEQELTRTRRAGGHIACLLLDIDFFKKINDAYGHSAGDDVLHQFAALLNSGCRPVDLIGRIGGEEFCVLMPDTDEFGANVLARRILLMLAAQPLRSNDIQIVVTASGGVAELRTCHQGVHSLIDSADAALLVAKQTGRNKTVTASSLEEDELCPAYCGPLRDLRAQDIMVPVVAHVKFDDTVRKTACRLMELNLDSVPVVDVEGKPIGFVTEQDLMTSMLGSAGANQRIADCSRLSVAVFEETVPAEEIASFFSRSAVQRVVIVRQGFPVGVLSRRTLLRWLFNHDLNQDFTDRRCVEPAETRSADLDRSIAELKAGALRLAEIRKTSSDEQLSSSVIGEATRIQESLENLLISCRDRRPHRYAVELLAAGASSVG